MEGFYLDGGQGKSLGNGTKEKWPQNRQLEFKLLTGLRFKLGLIPIFHLPVQR